MADVFLSYAHADRQKAEELARTLKESGWTVFWDRAMRSGPRFRDVIARELESAKCVVVLWSRAAVQSDWVIDEAEEARTSGRLVPAVIETIKPPHGFRGLQTANLVNWNSGTADAEFDLLLSGIEAHARRATPSGTGITSARPELRLDMARQNSTPGTPEREVVRHEESRSADQPAALSIPPAPPGAVTEPASITTTDSEPPPASVTPEKKEQAVWRPDEPSVRPTGDAVPPRRVEQPAAGSIFSAPVKPAVTPTKRPSWLLPVSVVFLGMFLVFMMSLVVLATVFDMQVPENSRFLLVISLALVAGFGAAGLGGEITARGHLPIPGAQNHVLAVGASGGIALFVIVFLLRDAIVPPPNPGPELKLDRVRGEETAQDPPRVLITALFDSYRLGPGNRVLLHLCKDSNCQEVITKEFIDDPNKGSMDVFLLGTKDSVKGARLVLENTNTNEVRLGKAVAVTW